MSLLSSFELEYVVFSSFGGVFWPVFRSSFVPFFRCCFYDCEVKIGAFCCSPVFLEDLALKTIHYAGPNKSDHMREAFAIIYMPDGTTYEKVVHLVTDDLGLKEGDKLEGERFPLVG